MVVMGSTSMGWARAKRERERWWEYRLRREGDSLSWWWWCYVAVNEGGFAFRALAMELCAFESQRSNEEKGHRALVESKDTECEWRERDDIFLIK